MKAASSSRSDVRIVLLSTLILIVVAAHANAATQLTLARGAPLEKGEYLGIVELTVVPGFDDAKVSISVDGQKIADVLRFPHRVTVDFGPAAVEHKISVTAVGPKNRRVQWHETINRGQLPLSVNVTPLDLATRTFEVKTTAPKVDPIVAVELWHNGVKVAEATEPPFRFQVPEEAIASGFVQVTARSKSGSEAADFWSSAGDVYVESIQVRTVPIFVSVVDRNGATKADVDQTLFRIMDNEAEGKIVEFGNAFDQPISIALLIDSSASMTYSIESVGNAAVEFVNRTLKPGDRCSVTAVQEVPRRKQPLTADREQIAKALTALDPSGTTALYDAIASAIRELKDEKNRRAIVVLTDGDDTDSVRRYEDIEKTAMEAGIPLYFVVFNTGVETHSREVERLKHLAAQTGGFVAAASNQDLVSKYREIERDLRAQFAILYQVADFVRPKEWRRIRVTLASPQLTARTIRGYFTP